MLTSLRYGLPTLPFVPRKGKALIGLVHDPATSTAFSDRSIPLTAAETTAHGQRPRPRSSRTTCREAGTRATKHRDHTLQRPSWQNADASDQHRGCGLHGSRHPGGLGAEHPPGEGAQEKLALRDCAERLRRPHDDRAPHPREPRRRALRSPGASPEPLAALRHSSQYSLRHGHGTGESGDYDVVERIEDEEFAGDVYDLNIAGRTTSLQTASSPTTPSIAGAARASRTCSSSAATILTRSCSVSSRTIARRATSSPQPTRSSPTTTAGSARICGPRRAGRAGPAVRGLQRARRSGLRHQPHPRMDRCKGGQRRDCAILYRSNAQSRMFEEYLDHGAHSVSRVRRPAVLRARGDQGRAGLSAPHLQSRRRRVVRARREPAGARHRRADARRACASTRAPTRHDVARPRRACIAGARRRRRPRACTAFLLLIEQLDAADHAALAAARAGRSRHPGQRPGRASTSRKRPTSGEARVENLERARERRARLRARGTRRRAAARELPGARGAGVRRRPGRARGKTACR